MSLSEYEAEVEELYVSTSRTASVLGLIIENYFGDAPKSDGGSPDPIWFQASYSEMQNVVGSVFESLCIIKSGLNKLSMERIMDE